MLMGLRERMDENLFIDLQKAPFDQMQPAYFEAGLSEAQFWEKWLDDVGSVFVSFIWGA